MCFYNSCSVNTKDLVARYNRNINEKLNQFDDERFLLPAYNHPATIIISFGSDPIIATWGLVPYWTRNREAAAEISKMTINARSETLFEKPSFREGIRIRRCIIPSTGYFEYHYEGKVTSVYFIYIKNEKVFSIGGIYDYWTDKETNQAYTTYTMITTPGNEFTNKIHNGGKNPFRMPFIIPKEMEERWLDPNLTEEEIAEMMVPFDADKMEAYEIDKNFRNMDPHNPDVIKRKVR